MLAQKPNNISNQDSNPEGLRSVPCNIMIEQMLLGNVLVDNDALMKITDFLLADHFYDPLHRKIYETILHMHDKGVVANAITLKSYFEQDPIILGRGGHSYLGELTALSATIINIHEYGRIIYDLAIKRKLIHIGEDIVNDGFSPDINLTAQVQLEVAEHKLYKLSEGCLETNSNFVRLNLPLKEAINRAEMAFKNKGQVSGVSTNFIDLDELLGGLQNSDLIIIAGRPSMGKTALATNLALNCCNSLVNNFNKNQNSENAKNVKSVGFFSLEMSSEQIASRMISMMSGISTSKLRTGHLDEEEFKKIVQVTKSLQSLPFYIDETPSLSVSALRTRARRLKRQHNLGIIFVDYLQLMRSGSNNREVNRVQEISEVTQGLKAIAKELNIPVIALSQLSRAVEQRDDKRPLLSDLRESGSIEQDADIVMFIYREDYYLFRKKPKEGTELYDKWQQDMEDVRNTTEIIVSKHRNGPIGTVKLSFDSQYTVFKNLYHNT